jgi:hypothetical protein
MPKNRTSRLQPSSIVLAIVAIVGSEGQLCY